MAHYSPRDEIYGAIYVIKKSTLSVKIDAETHKN